MWKSLQDILPKIANKYKIAKTIKAIEVCQEFRSLAPRFLSEEALLGTDAKTYSNSILTIRASNSSSAQSVQLQQHLILEALNQKYGPDVVKKIRIITG